MLLALLLASCGGDSFKIEGEISNLNGGVVVVVFSADSAMVDEQVELDPKGRFTFSGVASSPVIVSLTDMRGEPLVSLAVVNGDHLKVKGDASKPMSIKVKGNRLNEDWQLFRDEHASFYSNPDRLDAAIEKFVREHPADMLSTVLLMTDYSDFRDHEKETNNTALCCCNHSFWETNSLRRTMQKVECSLLHRQAQGRVSS